MSGVIALLLSKNHSLSSADAFELLRATSLTGPSGDRSGVVDACLAVVSVVGRGECKPAPVQMRLVDEGGGAARAY